MAGASDQFDAGVQTHAQAAVAFGTFFVSKGADVRRAELVASCVADRIEEKFSSYFLTSSLALMMALAIDEIEQDRAVRKTETDDVIGLWGVDMASKDEYILQRSGGHYFIQEAKRRGIKVTLPKESDLLQPPALYGFDDSTPFLRKIMVRKKELTDRLTAMRQQRDQLNPTITYLEGALEDVDYVISIWGGAQSNPID